MSSIYGIVKFSGEKVEESEIGRMTDVLSHWKPDKQSFEIFSDSAFGHLMLYNTPESKSEVIPYHDKKSGLVITADARIDNREELINALGINRPHADTQIILEGYKKWGNEVVKKLLGDFVLAIWNDRKKELFIARDQLGIKPLFYFSDGKHFLFSTEIKGMLVFPFVSKELNEEWIVNLLCKIVLIENETLYRHIHIVPPAHCFVITANDITQTKYWQLDATAKTFFKNENDYLDTFREKLLLSVKRRLRSDFSVAAELSGGLDSSGIVAIAHQLLNGSNQELHTFSNVLHSWFMPDAFPKEDERKNIEHILSHCGIRNGHFVSTDSLDILKTYEKNISIQDQPPLVIFSIFNAIIYEKAIALNCRTIFSGHGGDQAVSFTGGGIFEEMLKEKKYTALWKEIKLNARQNNKSAFLKLLSILFPAFKKLFIKSREDRSRMVLIKNGFVVNDKFLSKHNIMDKFNRMYNEESNLTVAEQQIKRISSPGFQYRILNSCLDAQSHRMEYHYPLLDVELLQFVLSLPTELKFKNGYNRYAFRKVMEKYLPQDIVWAKKAATSTNPFIYRNYLANQNKVIDYINNIPSGDRSREFIDWQKVLYIFSNLKKDTKIVNEDKRKGPAVNALLLQICLKNFAD